MWACELVHVGVRVLEHDGGGDVCAAVNEKDQSSFLLLLLQVSRE